MRPVVQVRVGVLVSAPNRTSTSALADAIASHARFLVVTGRPSTHLVAFVFHILILFHLTFIAGK
jgi:hypothetical protein